MNAIKLILLAFVSVMFSASTFAEHRHHSSHQQIDQGHYLKSNYLNHKSVKHKIAHHYYAAQQRHIKGHIDHDQQQKNVLNYPNYKVYRSVKHYSPTGYDQPYNHRLSYRHNDHHRDDDRRESYRLLAGALVLGEVLHHVHH